MALAVIATVLSGRVSLKVKDDLWDQPQLYTVAFLETGNGKSISMNPLLDPLDKWEKHLVQLAKDKNKRVKRGNETIRRKIKLLEKKFESSIKKQANPDFDAHIAEINSLRANLQPIMSLPEVYNSDPTMEAIAVCMANNGGITSVLCDEATILDNITGRHGKDVSIDVLLQGYSGSRLKVARKNSPRIDVDRARLCIGISTQPCTLDKLISHQELDNRGLMARFLKSIPKSIVGRRSFESRPIDQSLSVQYSQKLLNLSSIPLDGVALEYSPEAFEIYKSMFKEFEKTLMPSGANRDIKAWGVRAMSHLNRIAISYHMVSTPEPHKDSQISKNTLLRAYKTLEYFIEVEHVIAQKRLKGKTIDKYVADRIANLGKSVFSLREIHRASRHTVGTVDDLSKVLGRLASTGRIRRLPQRPRKNGRPQTYFEVRPDKSKAGGEQAA